jgi:hypothetical protein
MNEWKNVGVSGTTKAASFFENRKDGTTNERLDWRKYLTTREAAAYVGSTPAGIRNRVYRRQLLPKKFFGRLMFRRADLDRLIEAS